MEMLQTFLGACAFIALVAMCVYAVNVLWDVLWVIIDFISYVRTYARTHPEYEPPNKLPVKIVLYGARREPVERRPW